MLQAVGFMLHPPPFYVASATLLCCIRHTFVLHVACCVLQFQRIFDEAELPLRLFPYRILPVTSHSGCAPKWEWA